MNIQIMNIQIITGRTMRTLEAHHQTCKWKDNMKLGKQKYYYLPLNQPSKSGARMYFTKLPPPPPPQKTN